MNAVVSSRTPEGVPARCGACGASVCVEPSWPSGDAPCPRCGGLVWFSGRDEAVEPPDRDLTETPAVRLVSRTRDRTTRGRAVELLREVSLLTSTTATQARRRRGRRPGVLATLLGAGRRVVRRVVGVGAGTGAGSPYGDVGDPWLDG